MSSKLRNRYTAHFKFQVIMEAIKGEKSVGQLARSYNVHPIFILRWKKELKAIIHDYERRIRELERLIGYKEVEIASLKNFFNWELRWEQKLALEKEHKDKYGLNKMLKVTCIAKSTWYYRQPRKSYEAKYEYLRKPLYGDI